MLSIIIMTYKQAPMDTEQTGLLSSLLSLSALHVLLQIWPGNLQLFLL